MRLQKIGDYGREDENEQATLCILRRLAGDRSLLGLVVDGDGGNALTLPFLTGASGSDIAGQDSARARRSARDRTSVPPQGSLDIQDTQVARACEGLQGPWPAKRRGS